uniref:DDE Tnp4 domain-containing protein n=1 Tax=Chenopodium quinoa TaxID=63459 RepID=A0A803LM93_CHEQI
MHVGGETGSQWIHRMVTGHHNLCKEQLRLSREIFISLANVLRAQQLLTDGSGKHMHIEEQLGIGLYMLAKPASVRDVAERFQHGVSTISRYFHKVLEALQTLSTQIIRPYQSLNETPPEIQNNNKLWPFFKDCVGAIDGTLIHAVVADAMGKAHRDRKGDKSWNVMAVCSHNMLFTHINLGYEGSAHDSSVWKRSLGETRMGFPHPPPGKYYVVDSAYPNTLGYLSPHTGRDLSCKEIPITHQVEVMERREDHTMYDPNRKAVMDIVRQEITDQIWESVQRNAEVMEEFGGQEEDEELTDYEN